MLQDIPTPTLCERNEFVLETARLVLRRPVRTDAKAIARLANDRAIAENLRRMPYPYRPDDACNFIAGLSKDDGDIAFLIESAGEPIGVVGLDQRDPEMPELGYWLGLDFWGRGYATEAARAVIDYAFEEYEIDRLQAFARVVNPASRNVLEKCGFQWTGVELHRSEALGSSTPVDRLRLTRGIWSSLKTWGHAKRGATARELS